MSDKYQYTWFFSSEGAIYELAGMMKEWLYQACKERDLPATRKSTRDELKYMLVDWQRKEEERT